MTAVDGSPSRGSVLSAASAASDGTVFSEFGWGSSVSSLRALNDSIQSSWSEIQSRAESVAAERSVAVAAAADATSLLRELGVREKQLIAREKNLRRRETDVAYFKRPLDEREQALQSHALIIE